MFRDYQVSHKNWTLFWMIGSKINIIPGNIEQYVYVCNLCSNMFIYVTWCRNVKFSILYSPEGNSTTANPVHLAAVLLTAGCWLLVARPAHCFRCVVWWGVCELFFCVFCSCRLQNVDVFFCVLLVIGAYFCDK